MKTYTVKIGLYRCSQDGALLLSLDGPDGSGTRISGHKPVVANHVEDFVCRITEDDLRQANATAPAPRPKRGGRKP